MDLPQGKPDTQRLPQRWRSWLCDNPQSFRTDRAFAAASQRGGLIASGWMSCSIAMAIIVKTILNGSGSIGSPGVEEIRWEQPLRPGKVVGVKVLVLESRISSIGEYGVVRSRHADGYRGES
jgi:acyl dehydratase